MHNAFMPNPHDRLKLARELLYDTAKEAAEALGLPPPTYYAHENGNTGFTHSAVRYADFFKVNLIWLLEDRGPMKKGEIHQVLKLFEAIPPEKKPEAIDYLSYLASRKD